MIRRTEITEADCYEHMMPLPLLTPKRIYCKKTACVVCGFSFLSKDIPSSGEVVIKKNFTSKLRSDWSINMRQDEVKGRSDTTVNGVMLDRC